MDFINSFLSEDRIILNKNVLNREEAIRLAAKPLLERGDIKEEYVDDILSKLEELRTIYGYNARCCYCSFKTWSIC
ncbi:PTS sugar transporter subunit IIA [Clostridium sp. B9]